MQHFCIYACCLNDLFVASYIFLFSFSLFLSLSLGLSVSLFFFPLLSLFLSSCRLLSRHMSLVYSCSATPPTRTVPPPSATQSRARLRQNPTARAQRTSTLALHVPLRSSLRWCKTSTCRRLAAHWRSGRSGACETCTCSGSTQTGRQASSSAPYRTSRAAHGVCLTAN